MNHWLSTISRMHALAPEYRHTTWLFLKLLALIYFAAFASLVAQINGLVGPHGVLPYETRLADLYHQLGPEAFWRIPTLFWINAGDGALLAATLLGCFSAVLLLLGIKPRLNLILLFVVYLSLYHAGQLFLNFQWDYLLLETGFLAIFLVGGPTPLLIFLFHWLLFRLRFLSGISKVLSEDPSWANFSTLQYYFETQPLPHLGAWYAHQLPHWLLTTGTGFVFFAELIVPFFIFLGRRLRITAAVITIALQLMIIATSNHNFVNLLTILLCLFLLDDKIVDRILPARLRNKLDVAPATAPSPIKRGATVITALLIFAGSLPLIANVVFGIVSPTAMRVSNAIRPYGIGNIYHIFPTMQTERQELIIQGSMDGQHWENFEFKYKPQRLDKRPAFIVPHQPRLDWMVWFVPPQYGLQMFWFDQLMQRLAKGDKTVQSLFAKVPFQGAAPRYMRVLAYRYHFTTDEEFDLTGHYWKRELLGEFPNTPPRYP
ncbi:MAG: lipase maturation factor family protein [bacterium]